MMSLAMLGTDWTADGQGDRLDVLLIALGEPVKDGDDQQWTNLRLTGNPVTHYDRNRIRFVSLCGRGGGMGIL